MPQYHIFHATSDKRFTETVNQPREYAAFVLANNLDEAFKLSQNDWNPNWSRPHRPLRSTSVGDVIQADDGFYMVCGMGFKKLG